MATIPIDDYRRFEAYKLSTADWWQILSEARDFIREENGGRTLTPADELIHQLREERDAELVDLP